MKKIFLLLVALIPAVTFGQVEQINSFVSDIQVNQNGSFVVTETIEYDFGAEEKRGIYRTIPLTYGQKVPEQKLFQDRYITIEFMSDVTRDGAAEPYLIESTDEEAYLRIGDPDIFHTGPQIYQFSYLVSGALSYPGDITELYWNVTGNSWGVPINSVQAIVRGPEGYKKDLSACYRGELGSTETCDILVEDQVVTFSAQGLGPYQGITAALELDPAVVSRQVLLRYDFSLAWLGLLFATVIYFIVSLFRMNQAHAKVRPTIPMFDAPKNFSALFCGVITDNAVNLRDIGAGIIELAQKGYIHIERKVDKGLLGFEDEEFVLTLKKSETKGLSEIQQQLLTMLFGSRIAGTTFSTKTSQVDNVEYLRMGTIAEKSLKKEDIIQIAPYPIKLIGITFLSIFVSFYFLGTESFLATIEMSILPAILLFVFSAIAVRRRTVFGHEAKKHLDGLQLYIKVAEKDRIAFHDAPEKTTETFTKFLPYAIAFGLEKEWTKTFENLQVKTEWFSDPSGQTLNALVLSDALSHMTGSLAGPMPESSSSGSSGGGSSGGGSGGGGGGSW